MKKHIITLILMLSAMAGFSFAEGTKLKLKKDDYYLDSKVVFYEFDKYQLLNDAISKNVVEPYNLFVTTKQSEWDEYNKIRNETSTAEDAAKSKNKTPKFEYKTTCEKKIEGKNFISLLFNTYTFLGGAHGEEKLYSVLFNKSENKVYSITEVSSLSLEEISKICQESLIDKIKCTENYTDERVEWIKEGTIPTEESFKNFTFNEKNKTLTIYFEQYLVAPYSEGIQTVEIKLN